MDGVSIFRSHARNNAWSNHRLLTAVARLDAAAWTAPRTGFFPSLQATLNHILEVDRYYYDALVGGGQGPALREQVVPFPVFADLDREQRVQDARLIALCDRLTSGDPGREIAIVRAHGTYRETIAATLLHLFTHQIHHRGQAHAMLSGTGVHPPQLDEWFLDQDAPLRAGDLAALDWA